MDMEQPLSIADLFRNPQLVRDAFALIRKLEKLSVNVSTANGTIRVPVKFSDEDALVDLTTPTASDVVPPVEEPEFDAETLAWEAAVMAAGGTLSGDSKQIAEDLIVAIKGSSFNSKIKYLLPLLGSNLAAARVPLRDSLGAGIAQSHNFTDSDFSQSSGLTSDGSSKRFDLNFTPSQLGLGGNGGIGYWELNTSPASPPSNTAAAFASRTSGGSVFGLELRTATNGGVIFSWSGVGSPFWAALSANATAGHYYGQRASSSSRKIYIAGSEVASSSAEDGAGGASENDFNLMAQNSSLFYKGRCGVAYATDGTMTAGEISSFHSLLSDYLITPTGR